MKRTAGPDPSAPSACVTAAWQAHEAELRAYQRHHTADAEAAEDVLQDAFVKALRQGPGFCTLDQPRAWLFQVARNALIDRARTAHPHEPFTDELAETLPQEAQAVAPVDALAGCLARTLAELAEDDQHILHACDLEGQTQRAYAQAHGLSLPATKSRLLRARQRLRDRLTNVCRVRFERDGSVCGRAGRKAKDEP